MRPRAIHQFVPSLASRDAIGAHTLAVQDLLVEMGFDSEIYVTEAEAGVSERAKPFDDYARARKRGLGEEETWLLYQFSIDSPMVNQLLRWEEPKVVNYHNITPSGLLEPWSPRVAHEVGIGRRQLEALAQVSAGAIADSGFNSADLISLGYSPTAVANPLIDLDAFSANMDRPTYSKLQQRRSGGGTDLLFVGRITPHKGQHDLIKALAAYRRAYDPKARLHLVGGPLFEQYDRALARFICALGLGDAVEMAGSVSHAQLVAYYRSADALVCASDHEGFCVPLLEAMYHRVPIVAYAAAAVPETLAGAGLALPDKAPATMAAGVHRVVSDEELRIRLVQAGVERLEDFTFEKSRSRFARALQETLARRLAGPG